MLDLYPDADRVALEAALITAQRLERRINFHAFVDSDLSRPLQNGDNNSDTLLGGGDSNGTLEDDDLHELLEFLSLPPTPARTPTPETHTAERNTRDEFLYVAWDQNQSPALWQLCGIEGYPVEEAPLFIARKKHWQQVFPGGVYSVEGALRPITRNLHDLDRLKHFFIDLWLYEHGDIPKTVTLPKVFSTHDGHCGFFETNWAFSYEAAKEYVSMEDPFLFQKAIRMILMSEKRSELRHRWSATYYRSYLRDQPGDSTTQSTDRVAELLRPLSSFGTLEFTSDWQIQNNCWRRFEKLEKLGQGINVAVSEMIRAQTLGGRVVEGHVGWEHWGLAMAEMEWEVSHQFRLAIYDEDYPNLPGGCFVCP